MAYSINMKNKITVKKVTNTVKEICLPDGVCGIASLVKDKWEFSPNIRQHADEILKHLSSKNEDEEQT